MKTITFKGSKKETDYHGYDGEKPIRIAAGESAIVSDEKAAQIAADFPHLFIVDGKTPKSPATPAAVPLPASEDDDDDETDDPDPAAGESEDKAALLFVSLNDLKARAEKLGIPDVGKKGLRTKDEVADAILAKLAESGDPS